MCRKRWKRYKHYKWRHFVLLMKPQLTRMKITFLWMIQQQMTDEAVHLLQCDLNMHKVREHKSSMQACNHTVHHSGDVHTVGWSTTSFPSPLHSSDFQFPVLGGKNGRSIPVCHGRGDSLVPLTPNLGTNVSGRPHTPGTLMWVAPEPTMGPTLFSAQDQSVWNVDVTTHRRIIWVDLLVSFKKSASFKINNTTTNLVLQVKWQVCMVKTIYSLVNNECAFSSTN